MSTTLKDNIVSYLTRKIEIPFIPEFGEAKLIEMIADSIIPILEQKLPSTWVAVIEDVNKGFDEEKVERYKKEIKESLDNKLKLPELIEWVDDILINLAVVTIAEALLYGVSIVEQK